MMRLIMAILMRNCPATAFKARKDEMKENEDLGFKGSLKKSEVSVFP